MTHPLTTLNAARIRADRRAALARSVTSAVCLLVIAALTGLLLAMFYTTAQALPAMLDQAAILGRG